LCNNKLLPARAVQHRPVRRDGAAHGDYSLAKLQHFLMFCPLKRGINTFKNYI